MALTRTTAAGVAVTDTEVVLASIAGLAVSNNIAIDGEVMRVLSVGSAATVPVGVLRGVRGTNVAAHPAGAVATFGPPSDFSAGGHTQRREVVSVSANGVIANPTPGTDRVINGATLLNRLTLANPSKDNEGDILIVGSSRSRTTYLHHRGPRRTGRVGLTLSAVAQMAVQLVAPRTWFLLGPASVRARSRQPGHHVRHLGLFGPDARFGPNFSGRCPMRVKTLPVLARPRSSWSGSRRSGWRSGSRSASRPRRRLHRR